MGGEKAARLLPPHTHTGWRRERSLKKKRMIRINEETKVSAAEEREEWGVGVVVGGGVGRWVDGTTRKHDQG